MKCIFFIVWTPVAVVVVAVVYSNNRIKWCTKLSTIQFVTVFGVALFAWRGDTAAQFEYHPKGRQARHGSQAVWWHVPYLSLDDSSRVVISRLASATLHTFAAPPLAGYCFASHLEV